MPKYDQATIVLSAKVMALAKVQQLLIDECDSISREINTGTDFTIFGEPIEVKKQQLAGVIHALEIVQSIQLTK
jgi:hypothetical protein